MSLIDRVKSQAEQTASKAREGVQDVQSKRELGQVYGELGERTFELIESGQVSSPELSASADRIRQLEAELGASHAEPPWSSCLLWPPDNEDGPGSGPGLPLRRARGAALRRRV
jgi:hypothetical protein